FVFIVQVVVSIFYNFKLINKYGNKAQQYYSDMEDSRTARVTTLNASLLTTGVASVILAALGRDFFKHELTGIALASVIFSTLLFIIGWLGDQQKALNPTFDSEKKITAEEILFSELTKSSQLTIINKLTELFEEKKIYLDSKLNILDVAALAGSNRTYISTLINQNFNQNFCSYVNQYRIGELEKNIIQHPELSNQELAELCGFGSVDSMKRVIFTKTGKSMQAWRNQII
ncbi:MAG TPA: AraC family transcriptional regulator, partial [Paludibacter sp.]|nr:AraC family transcriptional regulator [Paludibacter sp.]